jgi:hypothetical protein
MQSSGIILGNLKWRGYAATNLTKAAAVEPGWGCRSQLFNRTDNKGAPVRATAGSAAQAGALQNPPDLPKRTKHLQLLLIGIFRRSRKVRRAVPVF